jgi:hypothetical protein
MVERCAMAVFAGDHGMMSACDLLNLVVVALIAILGILVLGWILLPLLFITQTVITEGIPTFLGPEVGRDVDGPEQ